MTQADTSVAEMVDTPQQGTHGGLHIRAVHGRRCCGACWQGLLQEFRAAHLAGIIGQQSGAGDGVECGLPDAGPLAQQRVQGTGIREATFRCV